MSVLESEGKQEGGQSSHVEVSRLRSEGWKFNLEPIVRWERGRKGAGAERVFCLLIRIKYWTMIISG